VTEEIFRGDAYVRSCEARVVAIDEAGIELDRTVFYPVGGGQPGDIGRLALADGREIRIADTLKAGDRIVHVPAAPAPADAVGQPVTAEIDWDRRHRLMRMHTCLHLLCALIPEPVTGGSIRDGSGRLDFDIPDPSLDKEELTAGLNRLIDEDHGVRCRWISDAELEKHPELVRTMSVKPPMGHGRVRLLEIDAVDLQPCGGTHVSRTGEIGKVRVTKIEKKGRQNRRVTIALDG
jgi:misacylated tRNA(Ala) deacylase